MDPTPRGRSPSASNASPLRHTPSASPHPPLDSSTYNPSSIFLNQAFLSNSAASGQFSDPCFTQDLNQHHSFNGGANFPDYTQHLQSQQAHASDIANHTFLQSAPQDSFKYPYNQSRHNSEQLSPGALNGQPITNGASTTGTSNFPLFDFNQAIYQDNVSLDPSVLGGIDQPTLDLFQPQPNRSNRNSLDPMMAAAMQAQAVTPPHMMRHNSGSPSPQASPGFQQAQFAAASRPRNASESLDPSSAAFPQGYGNGEWQNMYRGHRRVQSDQLSDISSLHNSPYLPTFDAFDINGHSSPMLGASSLDPVFGDGLGMNAFSLNDNLSQHSFHSPGPSPHMSPHLMAQQTPLPPYTAEDNFGMSSGLGNSFEQPQQNGLEMFPSIAHDPFPQLNQDGSPGDIGAADQMSPPEIFIHSVPTALKEEAANVPKAEDALSPPLRTQSRNRIRAKSDSHAGSRPSTPLSGGRGRSPSLQTQTSMDGSLAPFDERNSRSNSPARGRNGSLGSRSRSPSNASDHRDYILDLANPERTPSNDPSGRRQQKHPATFQCTLCPKRFTRAYNLRSHLRTHTDERPFVCTVCGKAFARQHDRKRHEGLHSGEKKFVCRGTLSTGSQWGCGRRFARADALGRHFRSEAGRVCIKPLLDEEAVEREKAWCEKQQQARMANGFGAAQPMLQQPQFDMMGNYLPQALLNQFPALANLDWTTIPQGNPPPEEDFGGRSSFDASSGGEYYDDMSENEMGGYPAPGAVGTGQQQYVQQPGDYLKGFEGR